MLRLISVFAIILACAAAGCADDDPPAAPAETPVQITEDFAGTLNVNGAFTHVFNTTRAGQATATLTSLSPDSTAVISFMFGTWNGQYCSVVLVKDDATAPQSLVGNASLGSFCIRVADIGRLTAATDYTITVTHF
jgi:hypothetical protein